MRTVRLTSTMRLVLGRRTGAVLFASLLLLPAYAHTHQQAPAAVSVERGLVLDQSGFDTAWDRATVRRSAVRIDTDALLRSGEGAQSLRLDLFPDRSLDVRVEEFRRTSDGGHFLAGLVEGEESGTVLLDLDSDGQLTGEVMLASRRFVVRPGEDGVTAHIVTEVDTTRFVPDAPHSHPVLSVSPAAPQSAPAAASTAGKKKTLDIMFVFGHETGQKKGVRELWFNHFQTALNQSTGSTDYVVRYVGRQVLTTFYPEGDTSTWDHTSRLARQNDGYMDEIHGLRNRYAADLVVLQFEGYKDSVPKPQGAAFGPAFASVWHKSSPYLFAHEVGHLLNLRHDRYQLIKSGLFPGNRFNYGMSHPGFQWRTIMAYPDYCMDKNGRECPVIYRFSNPDQTYKGAPLGVSRQNTSRREQGPADNVHQIKQSWNQVASLRDVCDIREYAVSQTSFHVTQMGGRYKFEVRAPERCVWHVWSDSPYVVIETEESNNGTQDVSFLAQITPFVGDLPRVARIRVAPSYTTRALAGLIGSKRTITVRQSSVQFANVCQRRGIVRRAIMDALGQEEANCSNVTSDSLAKVASLDLGASGIGSLKAADFAGLSGLTELDLSDNDLTALPKEVSSHLSAVTKLDLSGNRLTEATVYFQNMRQLTELDLSDNLYTTTPFLDLQHLTKLVSLDLSGNQISFLPAGLFGRLAALTVVDLSDNRISRVPWELVQKPGLSELHLSGNQLASLPAGFFNKLGGLQVLDLSGNQLVSLPSLDSLISLETLNVSQNKLASLPSLSKLGSLVTLNLGRNELVSLPSLDSLTSLETLNVSQNKLASLPSLSKLGSLVTLKLGDNELVSLPSLDSLVALETLDAKSNKLTSLPDGVFESQGKLKALWLGFNKLTSLPPKLFVGKPNLSFANVSGNPGAFFPVPISLQQTGRNSIKAVMPTGAPIKTTLWVDVYFYVPAPVSSYFKLSKLEQVIEVPAGEEESDALDLGDLGIDNRHSNFAVKLTGNEASFWTKVAGLGFSFQEDQNLLKLRAGGDKPTVSVQDAAAVTEGNTASMRFPVRLSAASEWPVQVPYSLGGSAVAGEDYTTPSPLSVTVAAGDTSADIVVRVRDDTINEPNETVTVALGTPVNATLDTTTGAATAIGTIKDDDPFPNATLTLTPTVIEESGGNNRSVVGARLSSASTEAVKLVVSAPRGPVALGVRRTLNIAAGETASTDTVTVMAVDNDLDADDAAITISAKATGGSGIADPPAVVLNILDDDAPPLVSVSDAADVVEGDDTVALKDMRFPLRLSAPSDREVTVPYSISGSAAAGEDFHVHTPMQRTIRAGVTRTAIIVPVKGDNLDEPDETITVTLGTPVNAGIDDTARTATGVIKDDDATPTVSLSLAPGTVREGGASEVRASLSSRSSEAVTLTVSTSGDAAALAGVSTLTIAAGALTSTGTVKLTAPDNNVDAADATVTVSATAAGGNGVADPPSVTLTVLDDDAVPTVSLSLAPDTVREGGASEVTASLSSRSSEAVTLKVSASGGGAALEGGGTLTIAVGALTSTGAVKLTAPDNNVDAADATVTVSATAAGGNGVADPAAVTLTVLDDDATPTVSLSLAPDTVREGGASEVTASLSSRSSEAVTLTVSTSGAAAALEGGRTLTIAAGALTSTGTVKLTAPDNNVDAADATVTVSATAAGGNGVADPAAVTLTVLDDDATPTVSLSLAPDTVREGGASEVTASLSSRSSEAVTLTVSASGGGAGLEGGRTLTIAAGALTSTGAVKLAAPDNNVDAADATVTVSATAAGGNGVADPAAVTLTVLDNDATPTEIYLTSDTRTVGEGDGPTEVAIEASIGGDSVFATDRAVQVRLEDRGAGADFVKVEPFDLVIPAGASTSTATFIFTPIDDDIDEDIGGTSRGGEVYWLWGALAGVEVYGDIIDIIDNDERGVTVSETALALAEDDDRTTTGTDERVGTYTVRLDSEPGAGAVTIAVTSADAGIATVSPPSLTFNADNWQAPQAVTVTAVGDRIDNPGDQRAARISHRLTATGAGNDYAGVNAASVVVTVADNDATPTEIYLTSDTRTVSEGDGPTEVAIEASIGGDSVFATDRAVQVRLEDRGAGADFVKVEPFDLVIPAGASTSTATFIFTPIDDDIDEDIGGTSRGGEVYWLWGALAGVEVYGDIIDIIDNDERGVTVSETALALAEADDRTTTGTDERVGTYTVRLDSEPGGGAVTIAVTSADAGIATVSPPSLTFNADNWQAPQAVTVTAVGDRIDNPGDQRTARISHRLTATGAGNDYAGVNAASVVVTVADDDRTVPDSAHAERWWNGLPSHQRHRALFGREASAAKQRDGSRDYAQLVVPYKQRVNHLANWLRGAPGEFTSVGAWWQQLDCKGRLQALAINNKASDNRFCKRDYPGMSNGSAENEMTVGGREHRRVDAAGEALLGIGQ